jgi:hypothetical protein
MDRECSVNGTNKHAHRNLMGGKRPLAIPRSRWVDIIKLDLRERI